MRLGSAGAEVEPEPVATEAAACPSAGEATTGSAELVGIFPMAKLKGVEVRIDGGPVLPRHTLALFRLGFRIRRQTRHNAGAGEKSSVNTSGDLKGTVMSDDPFFVCPAGASEATFAIVNFARNLVLRGANPLAFCEDVAKCKLRRPTTWRWRN